MTDLDEDVFPGPDVYPGPDLFPGAYGYVFSPPTTDIAIRIAGRGLVGLLPYGLSVWRSGGIWQQQLSPSPDQVASADRLYRGGRIYEITTTERTELIAAGYAAYIHPKEAPA